MDIKSFKEITKQEPSQHFINNVQKGTIKHFPYSLGTKRAFYKEAEQPIDNCSYLQQGASDYDFRKTINTKI
jgi:hypothetical protein